MRSIFKKNDETKREKHEENEPKEPANKRHGGIVIDSWRQVNALSPCKLRIDRRGEDAILFER
jgi:hypothetical protein